jgi:hypothetical protein
LMVIIGQHPGITATGIFDIVGGEKYFVKNALQVLRERNEVTLGGTRANYRYYLSDSVEAYQAADPIEGKDLLPIRRRFVPQSEWCKSIGDADFKDARL